ncbi:uncharacterized protein LOC144172637 [Haemaphysalis longicornis]
MAAAAGSVAGEPDLRDSTEGIDSAPLPAACESSSGFDLEKSRNQIYAEGEGLRPPITYEHICAYFVDKLCWDGDTVRAFKTVQAFQYVKSGKVNGIKVAQLESGISIVKGEVSPSQRMGKPYTSWIGVRPSGEILDAQCTCMAGLGRVCSHAAAVCFAIDFWTQEALEEEAPTDLPCKWVKPTLKKVVPKVSKDIVYVRHRCDTQENACPREQELPKLNGTPNIEEFLGKLEMVIPTARVFTLTGCRARPEDPPQPQQKAREFTLTLEQPLCEFNLKELNSRGCVSQNVQELSEFLMSNLSVTEYEANRIEVATRGQQGCPAWFRHRKGRITASIFKDVCLSKRVKCATLVNKMLKPRPLNTPAVQYGIRTEPEAKRRLLGYLSASHTNARLEDCGLMIHPDYPFFGCSPDAVFYCDCHEPALVEHCEPKDLLEAGKQMSDFCFTKEGTLKLTHAYYYQVQAQLHLNLKGISTCFFYYHLPKGQGPILRIVRDEAFMDTNIESLNSFMREIILPRMILM